MKITVFGSTGSIGRHIVEQALQDGHEVTAFSRHPEKLKLTHANLTLFSGDVFNPAAVSAAIKGSDAVLITLGSKNLTSKVRSIGTQNIVDAMQAQGIKRLICQSTLGVGESQGNLNFYWKYIMFGFLLRPIFKDHIRQEQIVRQSGLDWIIVHPSSFIDGPATHSYKQGFSPTEEHLSLKISRADVASFMLNQLSDDKYLHQAPGISY